MSLYQRLTGLVQKESDRLLKSFLDDNPDLLKKYVSGGVSTVGAILGPVNIFMRHLLTMQGLDPDSIPGEKQRLLIQEGMNSLFLKDHEEAFDEDYDLSWVQKKFEDTRKKMNQLEMTKETFLNLTDLSNLPNAVEKFADLVAEVNVVAPETPKKEIPLDTKEGRQEYRNRVLNEAKSFLKDQEPTYVEIGGDAIQALRDAVTEMEKKVEPKKKKGVKVSKKKLNKATTSKPRKITRVPNPTLQIQYTDANSTLEVTSDRVERPNWKKTPARNLQDLASDNKKRLKDAKESTPEFKAELKAKTTRATQLTNMMVEKGLIDPDDKARQAQINSMLSWTINNMDALERVVTKYGPTKDAIAENKFKGSFKRVVK
jgi:hypothetical protein